MSYEIRKVANGYLVMPPRDMAAYGATDLASIHVFRTWAQASAWLRKQLEAA